MTKGKLITLEGIDGVGKSTIAKLLSTRFKGFVFTKEPTNSSIGTILRKELHNNIDPLSELFLFISDHAEHISKVIRPSLESGKIVISDRYSDSRFAYQGVTLSDFFDKPMEWVQSLHKGWSIVPDLTILLTIKPEIALKRCEKRGSYTKFEKIDFLEKVQSNYLKLAKKEPERFVIINSEQEIKTVEQKVVNAIQNFPLSRLSLIPQN